MSRIVYKCKVGGIAEVKDQLDAFYSALERMRAVAVDRPFKCAVQLFYKTKQKEEMYSVVTTDREGSLFAVYGSPSYEVAECGEGALDILNESKVILAKLDTVYSGKTYELGDFTVTVGGIKVGKRHSPHFFIDVGYRPCAVYCDCQGLIREMCEMLCGASGYEIAAQDLEAPHARHAKISEGAFPPLFDIRRSVMQYVAAAQ